MDIMIMDFFKGIQFICCGSSHHNIQPIGRAFKDYYGIQYCHENYFRVKVGDDYEREVYGSWVLITRPGPEFKYGPPPGKSLQHSFVCFKGPRAERYIKSGLLPINDKEPIIQITRPEYFLSCLMRLIELLTPLEARNYNKAVNLLEGLLLQLHEQPVLKSPIPDYLRVPLENLVDKLKENPELSWDFEKEASECGVSYPHFRRIFNQRYNLPPGKFLILQRLRKATFMLSESDEQISSVAEMCGFDDQFYFSRLFKKYYHFSPVRYRREFRGIASSAKLNQENGLVN
jgi:AraC-like DNA-binding protein